MASNKKSFLLHIDSLDILDELTDEQAGILFKAICAFQKGEEIELDAFGRVAFSPFKNQFIRDDEKYNLTCKRRAEAGSKGGIANASKSKQMLANASKSKQDLANVADSKNKNKTKNDNDNEVTKTPIKAGGLVLEIFNYWVEVMKKTPNTTKLTPKREKAIKARIQDGYSETVIKTAILNCKKDPFSMGQNDRQKKFNDIELICRTGEKLESFMDESVKQQSIHNLDDVDYGESRNF